jgi:N-acetylneuraminic acid mutarotase
MPTSRVEFGACVVNGKIYAIGGATNHGASPFGMVEEYDPFTDTWDNTKIPMPTPRKGAAYGVIGNQIYVAGGTAVSNFTASRKLEIYDPILDSWDTSKAAMQIAIYEAQGAVINDKFYVTGGLLGSSPWTGQKIVQMYDPITGHERRTWTREEWVILPMSLPVRYMQSEETDSPHWLEMSRNMTLTQVVGLWLIKPRLR